MKQRLTQQRNRLFLRVILIIFAVWVTVCAVYCTVRLQSEKADVQNTELSHLSDVKRLIADDVNDYELSTYAFQRFSSLIGYDDGGTLADRQIILTNEKTREQTLNTAESIAVRYAVRTEYDSTGNIFGFIHYDKLRGSLSDSQFDRIKEMLTAERQDGRTYTLLCTRLWSDSFEIVPLQLTLVLMDENERAVKDEPIEVFSLKPETGENGDVFDSSALWRNIIPADFLLDECYGRDYIGLLTSEQQKQSVATVMTKPLQYIFYATDYYYLNDLNGEEDAAGGTTYRFQYARQVDLFENCRTDLLLGTAVLLVFFLIIAVILCVMIWKMVRLQIIQEQKRADMTNALAHDIKTPLFVISGYAYSLKEEIDADEREGYLDRIIEQTDEINQLVHNMLNLSKLDSCAATLNRSQIDLYALVSEITSKYTALAGGRHISLTHSGDSEISADYELLKTAVQNLTDNAVKYSLPDSEILIDVTGTTLCIANRSEPMSPSELKQIWQPYYRKDKSRHKEGNGLGLSIVKSVLDLHGVHYSVSMKKDIFEFRASF